MEIANKEIVQVQGTIESVVYTNEENGYTVAELSTDDGLSVTLVGTLPMATPGEYLRAEGRFSVHPTYGPQFMAERAQRSFPRAAAGILKYLALGGVKGIGPATARKIVDRFGDEALEIIRTEPERLCEIAGITPKRAKSIGESFATRYALRSLIEFLATNGLDSSLAAGLYKRYGNAATEKVTENPYLLCEEPFSANFFQVDEMAAGLGFEPDASERVSAGVLFELSYNAGEGHVFLPRDKLTEATCQLISQPERTVADALEDLLADRRVICEQIGGLEAIYLPSLYEAETFCAQRLRFLATREFRDLRNAEALLAVCEQKLGIHYAEKQREAILLSARSGVMALTGGPGTGKTTIVRAMLALFEYSGLGCELAAPTGRAAKRLGEVCGREARTIHRLLEVTYNESGIRFVHDEKSPLDADVLIVDELSMVDIQLFASLLRAVKNNARLILVGDADQLPSVGPGCVLRDLLASGTVPAVRLTEIFRQAEESAIVVNAHRINRGEQIPLHNRQGDFFFLRRPTPDAAMQTIVELCRDRLPKNMGFDPSQIQVLSPSRKNGASTQELNALLQEALNPPDPAKKEHKMAFYTLREGDRVMQTQNNYDLEWQREGTPETGMGVFNGDIGFIRAISPGTEKATVVFDDRVVSYDFDNLRQLELAYACTVHKAQGSEYPAVILAACLSHSRLLMRNLLYTAVTRAKKLLIIVGREDTIATMIENESRARRYSGLRLRLRGEEKA